MIKIISTLLAFPIEGQAENILDIAIHEKKVQDFIEKYKHKDFKLEWHQSCTTDGKNVFTMLTTFLSSR